MARNYPLQWGEWQLANPAPLLHSTAQRNAGGFASGDRVFHQKFGMGNVVYVDGDKLEIAFDRAGHKKVVAGFVSKP